MANVNKDYEIHPICKLFPKITGEEYEAMKEDIHLNGVLEAICVKGNVLFDGKNRLKICNELGIECPKFEFEGTEEEALTYAVARNMQRRQVNSSQRACIAIGKMKLANKYRKARGETEPVKEIGDIADEIAKQFGTNRTYIFMAMALEEAHPDLFKKVRDNELTITAANKEAENRAPKESRRGKSGRKGKKGSGRPKADGQAGKDEEVLDGLGEPVGVASLKKAFGNISIFDGATEVIRQAKDYIKEDLTGIDGTEQLSMVELNHHLDEAIKILKDYRPHAVHQECAGKGCKDCRKSGFLTKIVYDNWKKQSKTAKASDNGDGKAADKKEPEAAAAK